MADLKRKPLILPEWTKCLKADSCLNAKDIYPMIGVSKSSFSRLVKLGLFPAPDVILEGEWIRTHHHWSLGYLRKHEAAQT